MKKIIIALMLFFPFVSFAGGSHETKNYCESPPPVSHPIPPPVVPPTPIIIVPPPVVPPTPVIIVPPPVVPTPNPTPTPIPTSSSGGGGGGMIWCSGPSAPGWNVSLPNGGCSQSPQNVCVPITDFKMTNVVKGDGKIELTWNGGSPVTVWAFENNSTRHFPVTGNYAEVVTNGGWFWLSNECSETKMIDP